MKLSDLKGVGEKTLLNLNRAKIITVSDLINYFPRDYIIYEVDNSTALSGQFAVIDAVISSRPTTIKYRGSVDCYIFYVTYGNSQVKCLTFSTDYLRYRLHIGVRLIIAGRYKDNTFIIKRIFFDIFQTKIELDYKIRDVKNANVSKIISSIFKMNIVADETLPEEIIKRYRLLPRDEFYRLSHFPKTKEDVREVVRRRKYEEFFWYSMSLERLRANRLEIKRDPGEIKPEYLDKFYSLIPYKLTKDQLKAIEDIKGDLTSSSPMNRLVQGDVGCGKSIVAIAGILMKLTAGYQVAYMLPTEILANQQYELCRSYLVKLGFNVAILKSKMKSTDRADILDKLLHGRIDLVVGTHALIQDKVLFKNLGLVVIDEQHKFGVTQREKLIGKNENVDALYMSATPIPRTIGVLDFGDLSISSIHTLPSDRKSVITKVIDEKKIKGLLKFIQQRLDSSEQVYVVVPLVEMSDNHEVYDVHKAYNMLREHITGHSISYLHGEMTPLQKEKIMDDFMNREIKLLVSTVLIEVGISNPNATVIAILNAERFGLAQLHQLRGRVARGDSQGYCALVTNDVTNERLNVIASTNDGFEIADRDFQIRGAGDILGTSQSGFINLEYGSFLNDNIIYKYAKADARAYYPRFKSGELKSRRFNEKEMENTLQINKMN